MRFYRSGELFIRLAIDEPALQNLELSVLDVANAIQKSVRKVSIYPLLCSIY